MLVCARSSLSRSDKFWARISCRLLASRCLRKFPIRSVWRKLSKIPYRIPPSFQYVFPSHHGLGCDCPPVETAALVPYLDRDNPFGASPLLNNSYLPTDDGLLPLLGIRLSLRCRQCGGPDPDRGSGPSYGFTTGTVSLCSSAGR